MKVYPIGHVGFDKEPTQVELQKALKGIDDNYRRARISIGGTTAAFGEKKVILKAKTGGRRYARTDERVDCYAFYDSYTVHFNTNDPNKDDREQSAVDYYVYVFPVSEAIKWDNLLQFRIRNFGPNGWYCKYVEVTEQNWKYFIPEPAEAGFVNERFERFTFEGWVQTDGGASQLTRGSSNNELLQLRPIHD